MARYLTKRLLLGALTVLLVIVLTFIVQYLLPGDPARSIAGPKASPQVLANIREQLHLNDSVWVQLWDYIKSIATGDLGYSYQNNESVVHLIFQRLPATVVLIAAAMVFEVVIGGAWGIWEALRGKRSSMLASVNIGLLSIPPFAFGFLLLLLFGYAVPVFPVDGGTGPLKLIPPALTLGLLGAPYYSNIMRDSMTDALTSSYVRTAVSKGLPRRTVVARHVLRNSVPPIMTLLGLDVAVFLSGDVFVEKIFAWPGVGQLQTQAFDNVDRPLLTGTVIIAATLVVLANIVIDVARSLVDPRVSVEAL